MNFGANYLNVKLPIQLNFNLKDKYTCSRSRFETSNAYSSLQVKPSKHAHYALSLSKLEKVNNHASENSFN